LEGTGPLGPSPGYALAQDLKERSLTEKNQASYADFAQSCRNYADNRKKKPDYYRLSSEVLLHPKLGF